MVRVLFEMMLTYTVVVDVVQLLVGIARGEVGPKHTLSRTIESVTMTILFFHLAWSEMRRRASSVASNMASCRSESMREG